MIDFTNITAITIPEGEVTKITCDGEVLWEAELCRLPSAYQQVEYIELYGSQGIKYEETFADVTEISCTFAPTEFYGSYVGGSYTGGSTPYLNWRQSKSAKKLECYTSDAAILYSPALTLDTVYTVSAKADNVTAQETFTVEQNDTILSSQTQTFTKITSYFSPLIFGIGCNGYLVTNSTAGRFEDASCLRAKVYAYQHKKDGVLVRDFVPCYRISDGVIGMYDLISKTFYTNAGLNSFTNGPDILAEKCTMIYNLDNATLDNQPSTILGGETYSATIITTNGHPADVTVTMNGENVTSSVFDGTNKIYILKVTGDVVITASERLVNLLPLATDTDRVTIYNGIGYYNGKRWSSSSGKITTGNSTTSMTGFFDCKPGDVFRAYNYTQQGGTSWYIISFDDAQTVLKCIFQNGTSPSGGYVSPGYCEITLDEATFGNFTSIRLSWGQFNADSIVTINQEIPH